ncbi:MULTISPECIES: NAD(P)H-binding protein [unclassified Methylophaga]|uniref:NAD(P)H-binding protein n=1 Tax=unclassified Methylophaga TaxID=2629249 RepID=UPI00259C86FE|nr:MULTISPECIES: NAD(P)H-binding protein [unclassified Methylophaga]
MLGSGWLGLRLARQLQRANTEIKLSTRDSEKQSLLVEQGFDAYQIDIETPADFSQFLDADTLIINITNKNKMAYEQLIKQIEQSPIKQVLFISSSSVYQNTNDWVREERQYENEESILWQIESLFRQSSEFSTSIIRFSGLIGPQRHPGRFFRNGKQVQQADAPVNLIHLDDCIGIIEKLLEQQVWGEVLNGCADTHPSKKQFYRHAAELMNQPVPDFNQDNTPSYKIVSNDKVKTLLSYQFQYPDLMSIPASAYE